MLTGYIYQILESASSEAYVGQTCNDPGLRWQQHIEASRRSTAHNNKFYSKLSQMQFINVHEFRNSYFENNLRIGTWRFEVVDIITAGTPKELAIKLNLAEHFWIDRVPKSKCLNQNGGGYTLKEPITAQDLAEFWKICPSMDIICFALHINRAALGERLYNIGIESWKSQLASNQDSYESDSKFRWKLYTKDGIYIKSFYRLILGCDWIKDELHLDEKSTDIYDIVKEGKSIHGYWFKFLEYKLSDFGAFKQSVNLNRNKIITLDNSRATPIFSFDNNRECVEYFKGTRITVTSGHISNALNRGVCLCYFFRVLYTREWISNYMKYYDRSTLPIS